MVPITHSNTYSLLLSWDLAVQRESLNFILLFTFSRDADAVLCQLQMTQKQIAMIYQTLERGFIPPCVVVEGIRGMIVLPVHMGIEFSVITATYYFHVLDLWFNVLRT